MWGRAIRGSDVVDHLLCFNFGRYRTHALLACMATAVGLQADAQTTAASTFSPPDGCTGFLTVQSRACEVANYYRCEAVAPGDYWRAKFDAEGLAYVSRTNSEGAWIELVDLVYHTRDTMMRDSPDPPSFTTLIDTGNDQYLYYHSDDFGSKSKLTGSDQLTGRSVTIDGVILQETQFEFNRLADDGALVERGRGQQFIVPEWRMFFSGIEFWGSEYDLAMDDHTPEEFIFPGDPGFFTARPKFECNETTSHLRNPHTKSSVNVKF
jgi:hypothetical protein